MLIGLPAEIAAMDDQAISIFKNAMEKGTYKSYFLRIMTVGHYGVGKSTLTKRLLNSYVDLDKYDSTDGIDIYVGRCSYDRDTKCWTTIDDSEGT